MKAIVVFFLSVVIALLSPLSLATSCCAFHHFSVSSTTPHTPCHEQASNKACCDHHKINHNQSQSIEYLDLSADVDCQCDQSLVHYVLPMFSPLSLFPPATSSYLGGLPSIYHSRFLSVLDRPPIT